MDQLEELVRLRVIELRRSVGSQTEAILELSKAGFGNTRVAQLLGTSPNVVNVTLQKARKSGKTR